MVEFHFQYQPAELWNHHAPSLVHVQLCASIAKMVSNVESQARRWGRGEWVFNIHKSHQSTMLRVTDGTPLALCLYANHCKYAGFRCVKISELAKTHFLSCSNLFHQRMCPKVGTSLWWRHEILWPARIRAMDSNGMVVQHCLFYLWMHVSPNNITCCNALATSSAKVGWRKHYVWHMGGQVKDKWPATHSSEQRRFATCLACPREQN